MLLTLLACRHDDAERPTGPEIAFDLRPDAALFDAPFPSAHRLAGGRVRVDDWPNPDAIGYVDTLFGLGAEASGFGTTSGVLFRRVDPDLPLVPVDAHRSLDPDAPAFLVAVDGDARGERVPVDLWTDDDGGPFGAPGLVTLLPVQGLPLAPDTTYAAVLRRSAGADGPLGVPEALWDLVQHREPAGWSPDTLRTYTDALDALGVPAEDLAAVAVFRTWDPTAELRAAVTAARADPAPSPQTPLALTDVFDAFCVLESTVEMPVYQEGEPPYLSSGGGWVAGPDGLPILQGTATSRLWVTVPRAPAPPAGYPVAVMIRTGGGGDRPLADRGVRDADGAVLVPGTGPAEVFARAGFVGVQVDGPHGGPYRNPSGADEQFLMFNVGNPIATRDNVRQSALEIALLPATLAALEADATDCPGATADVPLDLDHLGLLGHSMGATIAPLVLAAAPEFEEVVLSGSGGSYLYNLVYKRSPIEVRPLAEALLGFTARGRTLREDDAVLQLLQWVSEPADPPPYARFTDADVLQVQGIVDTYILPPMANASSLGFGLDLAGPELDRDPPELAGMTPLGDLLDLGAGDAVALPTAGDPLRVVVQIAEDGIEDGHEVLFQTEAAKHQYGCFLASEAAGDPRVPAAGAATDPCD